MKMRKVSTANKVILDLNIENNELKKELSILIKENMDYLGRLIKANSDLLETKTKLINAYSEIIKFKTGE